ncbi:hypothetical protein ABPG74_011971 [Tetrahymena malaccensis]
MSYLLCFTQKKNQTLQENELEIPFSLKFYRFNFKQIKNIAQRLQPDFKKKVKSVQSQIEKVLLQSERTVFWMKLIQKFNILLVVAMIFGIYYMTLQGEDTSQDTFQVGVYILAATALLIILLQILCMFLWHYSFSQISHEVSLILLNETQRCGNQISWRLSRDYTSIIFTYQATALLTNQQVYQNNLASSKSIFQSNDNFNKKPSNASRFMKEKKQTDQKINIYSHQDEEKIMVKNIGVITEGNEQEIISAARINDDINMENDKYSDGVKNPDQFTINLGVRNESRKSIKEINIQSEDQVVIEMGQINHNKQPSSTSHKSKASIKQVDKRQSKIPSQTKLEEVIKFNSDNEDEDEENFQQDLCSEKQSQEQQVLNLVNLSELNKTHQLSNQKLVLPLILEQQNINSNRLILFNQSSNNQTEFDFNSGNNLKNLNTENPQTPQSIKPTNSDETAKEAKYKQSNFRNYVNNGDDGVDNMEPDDNDNDNDEGQNQDYSSIQNTKFKAFKLQLNYQDSPQYSNNILNTPDQNNLINQNFNLSPVKDDPELLSLELKTENSNKMINLQSQNKLDQDNQQINLVNK